ncbi:hypothetical protein ACGFW5_13655 [Streptomyces sp. NPDC048416]|uniref:hypothetical protein n=1 Tax=Streptomyces sp. NPDC048416 TaxID=3365546 RepID=UPI00370FAC12
MITSTSEELSAIALLRFATAGSVDDGKFTLVGRLLHTSKLILDDQLEPWNGSQGLPGPHSADQPDHVAVQGEERNISDRGRRSYSPCLQGLRDPYTASDAGLHIREGEREEIDRVAHHQ